MQASPEPGDVGDNHEIQPQASASTVTAVAPAAGGTASPLTASRGSSIASTGKGKGRRVHFEGEVEDGEIREDVHKAGLKELLADLQHGAAESSEILSAIVEYLKKTENPSLELN